MLLWLSPLKREGRMLQQCWAWQGSVTPREDSPHWEAAHHLDCLLSTQSKTRCLTQGLYHHSLNKQLQLYTNKVSSATRDNGFRGGHTFFLTLLGPIIDWYWPLPPDVRSSWWRWPAWTRGSSGSGSRIGGARSTRGSRPLSWSAPRSELITRTWRSLWQGPFRLTFSKS